jgi:hypothetical protein
MGDEGPTLYYMRNRWYEPRSGRFLSEDPIGLGGGINLYVFAGGDPVNGRDPSGLAFRCRGNGTSFLYVVNGFVVAVFIEWAEWGCESFDAGSDNGDEDDLGSGGGRVDLRSCGVDVVSVGNNVFITTNLQYRFGSAGAIHFTTSTINHYWSGSIGAYNVSLDLFNPSAFPIEWQFRGDGTGAPRGQAITGGSQAWVSLNFGREAASRIVVGHEFGHLLRLRDGWGPADGIMSAHAGPRGDRIAPKYIGESAWVCGT